MRVDGVSPSNAHVREWRRSNPGARSVAQRRPFRFSAPDFILDLSEDAIRQTGRYEAAPARARQRPPDTYTNAGTLAYFPPPDVSVSMRSPPNEPEKPARATTPRTGKTLVILEGMLRAPLHERTTSPTDR